MTFGDGAGTSASASALAGTVSDELAAFVLGATLDDIPVEVRRHGRLLMLDAFGIALANGRANYLRSLRRVIDGSTGIGPAHAIGDERGIAPEAAAEVNSSAIHGSDLDPTHLGSIIHPAAIAVPVALAVGEEVAAAGGEVLAAAIVGMEVLIRLGTAAAGRLHVAGFQATALLGPVAAALIAARLRRLTPDEAVAAAGLSTSVAAGLRSFADDETWGKRLITGWACRSGIHSAALAEAGWPGSRDGIEKRWGLLPAFVREPVDLDSIIHGLGRHWSVAATEIKPYPCSHGLHPFIDAAMEAREQVASAQDIAAVRCRVNPEAARWWFEPASRRFRPDPYGARFSIPYVVARALIDGRIDEESFTDDAVSVPDVLNLVDRVSPVIDPELAGRKPVGLPGQLEVELRDGTIVGVAGARPAAHGAELVRSRFERWSTATLGKQRARRLQVVIDDIEAAPSIRDVVALTFASQTSLRDE